jgi:hypothetical protein
MSSCVKREGEQFEHCNGPCQLKGAVAAHVVLRSIDFTKATECCFGNVVMLHMLTRDEWLSRAKRWLGGARGIKFHDGKADNAQVGAGLMGNQTQGRPMGQVRSHRIWGAQQILPVPPDASTLELDPEGL